MSDAPVTVRYPGAARRLWHSDECFPWWSDRAPRRPAAVSSGAGAIKAAVRAWFGEQGFVEVDTASCRFRQATRRIFGFKTAAHGPGLETQHALPAHVARVRHGRSCWRPARTRSSSSRRCFAIASAEALHDPEFTMLEWYREASLHGRHGRRGGHYEVAAETGRTASLVSRAGRRTRSAEPERMTVAEAFAVTPASTSRDVAGDGATATRWRRCGGRKASRARRRRWSDIFSRRR